MKITEIIKQFIPSIAEGESARLVATGALKINNVVITDIKADLNLQDITSIQIGKSIRGNRGDLVLT